MINRFNAISALDADIAWEIENLGKIPEVSPEHQAGFIAGLQQAKACVMKLQDD